MKRLILALVVLSTSGLAHAQKTPRNEIKLNGLYTLAGIEEVAYERLLTKETSVGISVALCIESDVQWKWGITPYYRWFFSEKPGEGVFIETHSSVFEAEFDDCWNEDCQTTVKEIGSGCGFALGYKMTSSRGWIGELYAGAGRNFLADRAEPVYPRLGFIVGRRFGS